MKSSPDFAEKVIETVMRIPRGKVTTYGALATFCGSPKSARYVGSLLKMSRYSSFNLPAYRVVNRHGMLTGQAFFDHEYPMKKRLEEEGVKVKNNQVVNFAHLFWQPIEPL